MCCVHNRLLVLDTASLYYRAFFGVPDSLRAPDGTVVNALRGTVDFLSILIQQYQPETVIAAWDHDWRPGWRVELLPSYKTHRVASGSTNAEDAPEALATQIPLIRDALELLQVPVIGAADAEADDVIGSLAEQWSGPMDIATGDRDLFQTIDDYARRRVLYTARGVKDHRAIDSAAVYAEYGIWPTQYVDFSVLRGDPSDGIAGVPGIGAKTAALLLTEFSDLAGIRAAVTDDSSAIKPKARQNLRAAGGYLDAAVRVIAVRRDLALPDIAPRRALTQSDQDDITEFAHRWGANSVMQRAVSQLAELAQS